MGQFLAIGLATKISIKKAEADKAECDIQQLQNKLHQELGYSQELYTFSENEKFYYFILKEDILQNQLIPFLETIYPTLYKQSEYYDNILNNLKILPSSEWLQWAEEKPGESFQFDEYGTCDYLEKNYSTIRVFYDCLLLSMEGKIMMEVFGRQFKFFKYTMKQAFKQFSLAGALRVYITG